MRPVSRQENRREQEDLYFLADLRFEVGRKAKEKVA